MQEENVPNDQALSKTLQYMYLSSYSYSNSKDLFIVRKKHKHQNSPISKEGFVSPTEADEEVFLEKGNELLLKGKDEGKELQETL